MSTHETSQHDADRDGHGGGDHGGLGKYVTVFLALCILTVISFFVGSSPSIMQTPALGWTIMMAVSCAKALLVMLFFMHLIWEANWKYVLTIPASVMSIFLLLMLFPDIGQRTRKYSDERWLHAARPADEVAEEAEEVEPHASAGDEHDH